MTTTELAELLLVRLYDLATENDYSQMWILDTVAAEFRDNIDRERVRGVVEALSNRGLIRRIINGRQILACITAEGAFLIERGGDTGVVSKFRTHPEHYMIHVDQSTQVYGDLQHSNLAVHSASTRQAIHASPEAHDLLAQIESALSRDSSLEAQQRDDAWADVNLIRAELDRPIPREGILREALATLGDISSIAALAAQLGSLLL